MSDIREPEYAEQLAHETPDDYLRRREFLQRAALTAGLASGLATVLSGPSASASQIADGAKD